MARVLIIDQDETASLSVEKSLARAGHDVRSLSSFADLSHEVSSHPPDVVMLEAELIGFSAEQFARFIRRMMSQPPVIVLWTDVDGEALARARRLIQPMDVLTKSSTSAQILRVVSDANRRAGRLRRIESEDGSRSLITPPSGFVDNKALAAMMDPPSERPTLSLRRRPGSASDEFDISVLGKASFVPPSNESVWTAPKPTTLPPARTPELDQSSEVRRPRDYSVAPPRNSEMNFNGVVGDDEEDAEDSGREK